MGKITSFRFRTADDPIFKQSCIVIGGFTRKNVPKPSKAKAPTKKAGKKRKQ